jgi:hypothetical protein
LFCFFIRTAVSWDTDIALLAGQEIVVEQKETIEFPVERSIVHNFVRESLLLMYLVVEQ